MTSLARWRPRALALGLVMSLLLLSVALAIRSPETRSVARLTGGAEPDYSNPSISAVAGVSDSFIRRAVGESSYRQLVRSTPTTLRVQTPARSPLRAPGAGSATAESSPITPNDGLLSGGSWELRLGITPDRRVAQANDVVAYAVTVRNVGRGAFGGLVRLEWHVPVNTRGTARCPIDSGLLCPLLSPLFISPGVGTNEPLGLHLNFFTAGIAIPAGGTYTYTFRVQINPVVPPNTVLTNHAHLTVAGQGIVTANSAPIAVTQALT